LLAFIVVTSVFKSPDKLVSSNTMPASRISHAISDKINLQKYLNAIINFTSINLD
jgi:hypothetical protein